VNLSRKVPRWTLKWKKQFELSGATADKRNQRMKKNNWILTYSELIQFPTFEERFEYLKLEGSIGTETFGSERRLNQKFYRSPEWRKFRRDIIIRDNGCDLGMDDYGIGGHITIHHLNPITPEDIIQRSSCLMDPENVICVSDQTHKAIHYGNIDLATNGMPIIRKPNDTCPWK
jgi:hypothetical protein